MLENIVIVGATGRLGKVLLARADPARTLVATRKGPFGPGHVGFGDDGLADPAALSGKRALVNCATLHAGAEPALHQANAELPERLALQARDAGIPHFVQLSTLRVFARAERIAADTPIAPTSGYGRTKLDGERRVLALQRDGFRVTVLRLPFLFGATAPSMLMSLARLLARIRVFPLPRTSPERAMLTFADAAFLIEAAIEERAHGILHAADSVPFTFERLGAAMRAECGRRLLFPRLPDGLARLAGGIVPRLGASLYSSERLDPALNFAAGRDLPVGLEAELARLARHCCAAAKTGTEAADPPRQ